MNLLYMDSTRVGISPHNCHCFSLCSFFRRNTGKFTGSESILLIMSRDISSAINQPGGLDMLGGAWINIEHGNACKQ